MTSGTRVESEIALSLYKELRQIAAAQMRSERGPHTLQPTALVHEAYLRLANEPASIWKNRPKILGLAAHAMRHVLVDYARARATKKRGSGAIHITLDENIACGDEFAGDVLAVDEALTQLSEFDPRQARIVELHFFSGLTFEEIAQELSVSVRTIKTEWSMARAWMLGQLEK
jgi:RNA polymerase sigma factor (TIGR02999 family)